MWINFSKYSGSTTTQEHKDLHGNPFSLKGKTTEQTPNNFTILINITTLRNTTWAKKTFFFLFIDKSLPHCISLTIFSSPLYFSPLLLALTPAVLQNCISPHTLGLHFFSSPSNGRMPLLLLLRLFLLFSLSHSSYQVTINANQLILTLLQPISFLQLSLSRMTLAFCFFLFFLPSNVSHKFNIT